MPADCDVREFAGGTHMAERLLSTRRQPANGPPKTHENTSADHQDRRPGRSRATGSPRSRFVAVDTEFMRENTYWPDLCLIQIASDEEAAAIDPKAEGIDLSRSCRSARRQRGRAEGLPRRRPGRRDHLQSDRRRSPTRSSTRRSRRWRSGMASRSATPTSSN